MIFKAPEARLTHISETSKIIMINLKPFCSVVVILKAIHLDLARQMASSHPSDKSDVLLLSELQVLKRIKAKIQTPYIGYRILKPYT